MLRKRIVPLLLVLCMLFTVLPFQAFAAEEIIASGKDPMEWKLTADGTLTISGAGAMKQLDQFPWASYKEQVTKVIIGDEVTSIAQMAFYRMESMTQLELGESLTVIGASAFEFCTALQAVHIPASVVSIQNNAFWSCNSLAEVTFDPQIQGLTLGTDAFTGFCAKELVIPGGVVRIGEYAFARNEQLTTLVLNEGTQIIESNAFTECPALTGHLYLPASLTKIGRNNFDNFSALWTSVEIRTSAAGYKFRDVSTLKEVTLAGDMVSVPQSAFENSGVESLSITANITEIQDEAFCSCTHLKQVNLPETLQTLGYSAFAHCGLTSVTIPDSVTTMDDRVFNGCENLTAVKVGTGLETLPMLTFGYSPALQEIDFGNVKTLEAFCLESTGMTSVVIPETVTSFQQGVFRSSDNLESVHFLGDAPTFHQYAFENTTTTVYYEMGREGWNHDMMLDYGGNITWKVYGHEHSFTSVVTPPDCVTDGYTTHSCAECGYTYKDTPVAALGHTYTDWTVTKEAVCTTPGSHTRTCTVCRETFTEEIPAPGHNFEGDACTVCGEIETVAAPEILSCYSKQQTSVKVTWTLEEGADGYELWRTSTPENEDSWTRIKTVSDGTQDRYTNQGLEEGVTYYYKVRAFLVASDGQKRYSDFSEADYMPAAVVWDDPYSNATFRIRLRWDEIGGAHGYQLWRLDNWGEWKIIKTLGDKDNVLTNNQGATTAYSNTGLTAGDNYTYRMRAFRITEDGKKVFGAYSDEFTVAVMPEAPVVTAASPKEGRVQLYWEAINGAAGYQVWMQENGSWSIVKSVTDGSTTYTKTGLTAGTEYRFKIRAYTEVNGKKTFGDYSATVSSTAQGPAIIASGKCGSNLTWKLDDTGTLTISGSGVMYDYEVDTAPWTGNVIRKVVVESGVTAIGNCAFYSENDAYADLVEITLPKSVTEIGDYAFAYCTNLTAMQMSEKLKTIGRYAFMYCNSIEYVTLPDSVSTMEQGAFFGCKNLLGVYLPASLTVISRDMFMSCSAMVEIFLPAKLKTVEVNAFKACNSLAYVYFLGDEDQLSKIVVYSDNDPLLNAAVYLVTIITQQSRDTTVKAGEKVTLRVTASREEVTYQWYYLAPDSDEWLPCTQSGNKTNTLTFTATKDMDGYYFLCEVSDEYGSYSQTEPILLTVK
ncbi:MAG: leucine-rich repeat protein [Oscillospiraceae bacterium]|nr:leucine-rich repeat protein [Oscillospiraceae bacterium]